MAADESSPLITQLLGEWRQGDRSALEKLAPLVYPDLRRMAASMLRAERPGHTLQATGLVHELFVRLAKRQEGLSETRTTFFLSSAHLMRLILREWARNRHAQKRGGRSARIPLSDDLVWVDANSEEILDLDRALEELAALDSRKSQIAELRFFLGASVEEMAELLDVSARTIKREIAFIKAWLYRRLRGGQEGVAE